MSPRVLALVPAGCAAEWCGGIRGRIGLEWRAAGELDDPAAAVFAVTGKSTLGGDVSSSGSQTYSDTTTLGQTGSSYTFTGSALSFNGLAAGDNDLAFHADSALAISGTLSGTGHVSIAGQSADKAISVGGPTADANDLEISNSTLALFGTSFSGVTIGRADGTGNISYSPANHTKMVHLRQSKIDGIAHDMLHFARFAQS